MFCVLDGAAAPGKCLPRARERERGEEGSDRALEKGTKKRGMRMRGWRRRGEREREKERAKAGFFVA